MAAPLPGLADLTDFTLEPVRDAVGLYPLDLATTVDIRFLVLDAGPHGVVLPRTTSLRRFPGRPDPRVLARVNTSDHEATANPLTPVLVNPETGACTPAILEGQDWPLRSPSVPSPDPGPRHR